MGYSKIIVSALLLPFSLSVTAQSKVVKQYLEQIAANKVYIDYLQKGWKLAQSGLRFIGDKHYREYSLHQTFYDRLLLLNPAIANLPTVRRYAADEERLTRWLDQLEKQLNENKWTPAAEQAERKFLLASLLAAQTDRKQEWTTLITDGQLALSDAERLKRLEALSVRCRAAVLTAQSAWSDGETLRRCRQADNQDISTRKVWYDLK